MRADAPTNSSAAKWSLTQTAERRHVIDWVKEAEKKTRGVRVVMTFIHYYKKMHVSIHASTHIHTHARTYTHTHAHTYTHTHAHSHAHTQRRESE